MRTEAFVPATDELATLLELGRRARDAQDSRELSFTLVNDSTALAPYRQAALVLDDGRVEALSGVLAIEANVPYVQWVAAVAQAAPVGVFAAAALPPALASQWADWWPAHALRVPVGKGVLLLARETPFTAHEQALLQDWCATWWHAWQPHARRASIGQHLRAALAARPDRPAWRRPRLLLLVALLAALACPVRLTVLAPGELVPANPVVVRAPLDGVLDTFHVKPNQSVIAGQPLFGFDEALIRARQEMARQALATVETDYRQTLQAALGDAKAKGQLAVLTGQIEEKRAEAEFLASQLARAVVNAPREGIVLMDDPSEWIGKPVTVGERILRIAAPGDAEVEAWLPIADAIELPPGSAVTLHLDNRPLAPVVARIRWMAHDASPRPDGSWAYRVRATLEAPTDQRVGLRGTVRMGEERVPLAYWALRRPLAVLRAHLGR